MHSFFSSTKVQLIFLSLAVFLSRLPFFSAGFGAEEDAWLIPLTAKHIALNGYEMSRAPGHPLQEIIYSLFWNAKPFWYNLFSAIASIVATLFFALALKKISFKNYLFASFAFAFTPVVFISSTYCMDYMIAMAFVMGSFYFILKNNLWLAGIFLGIGKEFRIQCGAMLLPFLFLIGKDFRKIFLLIIISLSIGLIAFIPVIKTYGLSFFTYSDQFPYPNLSKVFYKGTIGVFGIVGIIAIVIWKLNVIKKIISKEEKMIPERLSKNLFYCSYTAILLYIFAYLQLPQKSAYLIPIIPFTILLFGYYLSSKQFKILCVLLTLSSFTFSMNLSDSLRGAKYSSLAIKFNLASQEIFLDPLTGPVFSDYTKRLNKIAFTEEVFQKIKTEQRKIILICGWWYNELRVRNWNSEENKNVKLFF